MVDKVPVGSVEYFGDGGLGGFLVDEGFAGGECGDEGLQAEVVDCAGVAAGCGVDEGDGVVGEQLVAAAGEAEVVLDVLAVSVEVMPGIV